MTSSMNFLLGWNQQEAFICVLCGFHSSEPIQHLKKHMTQSKFHCTDCDVECGESTEGYDSFVRHVERTRHLNYIYTCMKCSISEFDFGSYIKHLQLHSDEHESDDIKHSEDFGAAQRLHDIKTESDTERPSANFSEDPNLHDIKTEIDGEKHSVNPSDDQRIEDIKTESNEAKVDCSNSGKSVEVEERKLWHVKVDDFYKAIDKSEMLNVLPSTVSEGSDKFQCLVCDVFVPKAKEHAHMHMHLKDTIVEIEKTSGKIRFKCQLCGLKSSRVYTEFLMHVKFHEDAAKHRIAKARKIGYRPVYTYDTCRICKWQHASQASLFVHVLEHFPDSLFYCRVCFEFYNDYQSCRDHFNSHELEVKPNTTFGVYFMCPLCGRLEIPNNPMVIIDHLTKGCDCRKGAFDCKTMTANLLKYEQCCIVFEDSIHSCNFKCDDAASLCSHVLQHILSNEVPHIDDERDDQLSSELKMLPASKTSNSSTLSRLENDLNGIVPAVSKEGSLLNADAPRICQNTSADQQTSCKQMNRITGSANSLSFTDPFYDSMVDESCIVCGITCMTLNEGFEHVFMHFPGNVFYCRGCFQTFSSFNSAFTHSRECGVTFLNNTNKHQPAISVGFICATCGHSNVCNQRKHIMSHLFQHYNDSCKAEHIAPEANFACKRIAMSLMCYRYSSVSLARDTASCEEKFDHVQSLCKHVQQHIIKSKRSDEHIVSQSTAQTESKPSKAIKTEKDDDLDISGWTKADIAPVGRENNCYKLLDESKVHALALPHITISSSTGESKCVVCEMVLLPEQVYSHVDRHMKNTTVEQEKNYGKYKFTCKLCNSGINGECFQYLKHVKYHEKMDKLRGNNHLHMCHICGEIYLRPRDLLDHILTHYPEALFYCRVCWKSYKDYEACRLHYAAHKIQRVSGSAFGICFQCYICGQLEIPNPPSKVLSHLFKHNSDGFDWENGTSSVSGLKKGEFVCRKLVSKLLHYEHCSVLLKGAASSCDFQCDNALSLYSHIQQHIYGYKWHVRNQIQKSPGLGKINLPSLSTEMQENDAEEMVSLGVKSDIGVSLSCLEMSDSQKSSEKDINLMTYATNSVTLLNSYHDIMLKKSCIICGGTSKTVRDFLEHVSVHFPDNIFYCRCCFKTFRKLLLAVKHSKQQHASTPCTTKNDGTVGFICSLCGHNDFSTQNKYIIAHLFQHYDQAKDPEFTPPQKRFLCRRILPSLVCYKYFLTEFDNATVSCEQKFDNVRSLCDHIQQHIVKSKVKSLHEDSKYIASTASRRSKKRPSGKQEVVEPPGDLPSGRSVAIQFGEANTSETVTSQLSVEQCDVAEVDIKDERDSLGHNTTVALNVIKEEKMESPELIDLNSYTSATTSQKVIPVPSVAHVSMPSAAVTVDPSSSAAALQPKPFSNFVTEISAHSKRTFETVFTDSYHSSKQVKLKEQESKISTRKSKIKIFVCKVCGKRFIEEHFLKKHMSKH